MARPTVVVFHRAEHSADPPLTRLLAAARTMLVEHQRSLFRAQGVRRFVVIDGAANAMEIAGSFGERLAAVVADIGRGGLVVYGSGAVPLLAARDVERLVRVAGSGRRHAVTNNRYSSDVCAVGDAGVLRDLPPLPSDNALPRWLEERGATPVAELGGRSRLGLDLDSPLDLALLALDRRTPAPLAALAARHGLAVPRLSALRALAQDPGRELLIHGRSGSRTLRWLERNVRCRVRFLAEERGMRAASELARGERQPPLAARPPRSVLGRLLAEHGPRALGRTVAELADGAVIDGRVLLADRLGAGEAAWPSPEDRFASDLGRPESIADPWLGELTSAVAAAPVPILLGAHTLVGPGIRVLLGGP